LEKCRKVTHWQPTLRAPRDAVLNTWRSQEELGGLFLGHRAYLAGGNNPPPKGKGDNSMLEKRGLPEDAKGTASRGPPDRAKATLPEPQSPAGK